VVSWKHGLARETLRLIRFPLHGRMVLAPESGHGSWWLETARVADSAIVLHDFEGDLATLTSSSCVEGTGLCDILQHALLPDTFEDSSGLDQGVANTAVCHCFGGSAGGGYLVAASEEETAVRMEMDGWDLGLESAGRRCETVGEDSGGEFVHEVTSLLLPFGDGITGAFALDIVEGDDLLGGVFGRDYRFPR